MIPFPIPGGMPMPQQQPPPVLPPAAIKPEDESIEYTESV